MLPSRGFAEVVASLRVGSTVKVQPLGIRLTRKCLIEARIFPLTSLYGEAENVIDACIVAPTAPTVFVKAVFGEPIPLTVAEAVEAPCPDVDYSWRVEAVVAARTLSKMLLQPHRILFKPVYVEEGRPFIFRRVYGCIVEALVAATRALAAYRETIGAVEKRITWCRTLARYWKAIQALGRCVYSTAEDVEVEAFSNIVRMFTRYALLAGCPPED